MSSITFQLPENLSITIMDQDPGDPNHNRLDDRDRVIINGQRFNPFLCRGEHLSPSEQSAQSQWDYLLEVLQLEPGMEIQKLWQAQKVFHIRQGAYLASEDPQYGTCARSDELLRLSNTMAHEAGLPGMAYSELASSVGTYFFTLPDGQIRSAIASGQAQRCSHHQRGGAFIESRPVPNLRRMLGNQKLFYRLNNP